MGRKTVKLLVLAAFAAALIAVVMGPADAGLLGCTASCKGGYLDKSGHLLGDVCNPAIGAYIPSGICAPYANATCSVYDKDYVGKDILDQDRVACVPSEVDTLQTTYCWQSLVPHLFCQQNVCPDNWIVGDGGKCTIYKITDYGFASCSNVTFYGVWDKSEKQCISCSGFIAQRKVMKGFIGGDLSGIYVDNNGYATKPDGYLKCESACGADAKCDETEVLTKAPSNDNCNENCQVCNVQTTVSPVDCGAEGCKEGNKVRVSLSWSGNGCIAPGYLASITTVASSPDESCLISENGGDMKGMGALFISPGQTGSYSYEWVLPPIPKNCAGKTMKGKYTDIGMNVYDPDTGYTPYIIYGHTAEIGGSFNLTGMKCDVEAVKPPDVQSDSYMKGVQTTCSSGSCTSTWTVPTPISPNCYGQTVKAKGASISGGNYPGGANNEVVASATPSGSITFGSCPAPNAPGTPQDDGTWTSLTTQLHFSWTGATDNCNVNTGIKGYFLSIGTSQGGDNVVKDLWVGNVLSYTATGLSLQSGTTYYAKVKARNNMGSVSPYSGNSNGITVDAISPSVDMITFTPGYGIYTKGSFTASASVSDGISGIDGSSCEVCLSTATPCSSWSAGTYSGGACSKSYDGYSDGQTLYGNVRIRDNAGNLGNGAETSRIVDTQPPVLSNAVTAPSALSQGKYYTNSTPMFGFDVSDAKGSGVQYCTFTPYRNGAAKPPVQVAPATGKCNALWVQLSSETLLEGDKVYVSATATDNLNNVGGPASTTEHRVDVTPPSYSYYTPTVLQYLTGQTATFNVYGITDAGAGPDRCEFTLIRNGAAEAPATADASSGTCNWTTPPLKADDDVFVLFRISDKAGNWNEPTTTANYVIKDPYAFRLNVTPRYLTLTLGETGTVKATIQNRGFNPDSYGLSIAPGMPPAPQRYWITLMNSTNKADGNGVVYSPRLYSGEVYTFTMVVAANSISDPYDIGATACSKYSKYATCNTTAVTVTTSPRLGQEIPDITAPFVVLLVALAAILLSIGVV